MKLCFDWTFDPLDADGVNKRNAVPYIEQRDSMDNKISHWKAIRNSFLPVYRVEKSWLSSPTWNL